MNKMVSNEEVEAGLLDQFAFASQQLLLDEKVNCNNCNNLHRSALLEIETFAIQFRKRKRH